MASKKEKALKTLVKKPTSVCASLVPSKNRLEWTAQEENFLVDEFALRKVGSYTFNFIFFLFCILTAALYLLEHSPRCP